MAGGLTLQVRQIGSYPEVGSAEGGGMLLVQPGGLGNPYAQISATNLVATALLQASMGVGYSVPADANPGQIFLNNVVLPFRDSGFWNAYNSGSQPGSQKYWQTGVAGQLAFDQGGWQFLFAPSGFADQPIPGFLTFLNLDQSGAMSLPYGTLTVARDPAAALEVATMGWVGANTVNSFNNRRGAVTLQGSDIYTALCLDSSIATQNWVWSSIKASFQNFLATQPLVFGALRSRVCFRIAATGHHSFVRAAFCGRIFQALNLRFDHRCHLDTQVVALQ